MIVNTSFSESKMIVRMETPRIRDPVNLLGISNIKSVREDRVAVLILSFLQGDPVPYLPSMGRFRGVFLSNSH